MYSEQDFHYMRRALELSELGLFTTTPNPRVGCILVANDVIVGEGWHQRAGEPHAEVLALAQAGERARGATAYVTLEPCSHFGRTPPCIRALIDAKVARVIAAMEDPNPRVSGTGFDALRKAGIEVRCGLMSAEALALNVGFVSRMRSGKPWVRLKTAISLDGRIALPDGRSQWITGAQSRADGHRWRARACAVLTGVGTVKADDPLLTVRDADLGGQAVRQPLRVVVDSKLEVPLGARIVGGDGMELLAPTLLAHLARKPDIETQLVGRGVQLLSLANADPVKQGKLDLSSLLDALGQRGINELHLEAGAKLNTSFLLANLVDELLVYQAPIILGDGPSFAALPAAMQLDALRSPYRWNLLSQRRLGDDQRFIFQKISS
jgi:diaminohydroxyphosphoribosylaminopyrimidine deaminase / 5-amino-6-(5-phosphoribosylamino)uracil reductase